LINLLAAFVAVSVSILNTRTATRVEIEASLEVAQRFVNAALKDLASQGQFNQLEQRLPLQLKHLRHVRIHFMDSMGQLTVMSPETESALPHAPRWFAALVRPQLVGRAVRVVAADGINPLVIVGEPADEIAEAWRDLYYLAIVWFTLDALILVILYIVLGRLLEPLQSLSRGMARLEDGHYTTRLPTPKVKELALITNRFNTLAEALDVARKENSGLYRQLISVQEEERREIANELHDEAGPCLFGITANASSIRSISDQLPGPRTAEINHRVGEILGIVERLKLMNRALLKKLRPGSHGRVGLGELINELIAGFERRRPGTHIVYSAGRLAQSYGEPIDLTLYRCVQEGITNAIRHGRARNLIVNLVEESGHRRNGANASRPCCA
jgi:two-component system sensor histidine kinase UhpB